MKQSSKRRLPSGLPDIDIELDRPVITDVWAASPEEQDVAQAEADDANREGEAT